MDALLSPPGLFSDAVTSVVVRFQEAKKQAEVFQFGHSPPVRLFRAPNWLERLVSFVYFLAEWKLLLNISQWALHSIEKVT